MIVIEAIVLVCEYVCLCERERKRLGEREKRVCVCVCACVRACVCGVCVNKARNWWNVVYVCMCCVCALASGVSIG